MALELSKRAIGVFPDRQTAETALDELKQANFPMDKVSVVAPEAGENNSSDPVKEEVLGDKTVKNIGLNALAGGAFGAVLGWVLGYSSSLLPGNISIFADGTQTALISMAIGSFFGGFGGSWIGVARSNNITQEQSQVESDRLKAGKYLVVVDGQEEEINKAQSLLAAKGLQN